MKTCTRCGTPKSSDEYRRGRGACRACERAIAHDHYVTHRDPAKPWIAKSGPTVDFYTLWAWIDRNVGRQLDRLTDISALIPTHAYQTIRMWRDKGIRIATARKIATHFGVTPTDIWPNWPKGYEQ